MRKLFFPAAMLIGALPQAHAATVAYTLDKGGDGIQLSQVGGNASGFTFSSGCTNKVFVGGFQAATKLGRNTWAITIPAIEPSDPTSADAILLDEQKLTWVLYYESTDYAIPWTELNSGTLTKTKTC